MRFLLFYCFFLLNNEKEKEITEGTKQNGLPARPLASVLTQPRRNVTWGANEATTQDAAKATSVIVDFPAC